MSRRPGQRFRPRPARRSPRRDWVQAARFYARFGITEAQFRFGVPDTECDPDRTAPLLEIDAGETVESFKGGSSLPPEWPAHPDRRSSSFDLTSYRRADRKWKIVSLYTAASFSTVIGLLILVVAFAKFSFLLTEGLSTTHGQILVFSIAAGAIMVAAAVQVIPKQLSGAEAVTIDDKGIHFTYARGTTESYVWGDTNCRFSLRDYSKYPSTIGMADGFVFDGGSVWSRCSFIPKAAFDKILARAEEHAAEIQSRQGSELLYGVSPTIHRIRFGRPPVSSSRLRNHS